MNQNKKIIRRMRLVIPAMVLCIIGDYCIGLEPKDAGTLGDYFSAGWLTVADWRITLSNIFGTIGSVVYAIGAVSFIQVLLELKNKQEDKKNKRWLDLYIAGLGLGCVSFMYFHIACGSMIQDFKALYEASGGDIALTTNGWLKIFLPEVVTFVLMFIGFDIFTTIAWLALILKGILPVSKWWLLACPLVMAGIGCLLEVLPLPVSGLNSGFESLGWMLMFVCGIRYIESTGTVLSDSF